MSEGTFSRVVAHLKRDLKMLFAINIGHAWFPFHPLGHIYSKDKVKQFNLQALKKPKPITLRHR